MKKIREILKEFEQRLLRAEDLAFKDVDLVYEEKDKALEAAESAIKQAIIDGLSVEKTHPHLNHSTRDEDTDGGWCDDCQATFEIPVLYLRAWNDCLYQVRKEIENELG